MIYDVKVSLLVDGNDENDAEIVVRNFLENNSNLDYNFLIHTVEKTEDISLAILRKRIPATAGEENNK